MRDGLGGVGWGYDCMTSVKIGNVSCRCDRGELLRNRTTRMIPETKTATACCAKGNDEILASIRVRSLVCPFVPLLVQTSLLQNQQPTL